MRLLPPSLHTCSKCFCDKGYHGDFCQFAPEEGVKPDDAPGSLFVGPVVEEPVSQFAFQKYVGVTRLYSAITGSFLPTPNPTP